MFKKKKKKNNVSSRDILVFFVVGRHCESQRNLPLLCNSAARWSILIILPPDVSEVELSFWKNSRSHTSNMLLFGILCDGSDFFPFHTASPVWWHNRLSLCIKYQEMPLVSHFHYKSDLQITFGYANVHMVQLLTPHPSAFLHKLW